MKNHALKKAGLAAAAFLAFVLVFLLSAGTVRAEENDQVKEISLAEGTEGETVEVNYKSTNGHFLIDGVEYGSVLMTYPKGEYFRVLTPEPPTNQLTFAGWYTGMNGKGTAYTEDTVIEEDATVYANWQYDWNNISPLEAETDYHIDIDRSVRLYSFTPDESTVYELYTTNVQTDWYQAYVRIMDRDGNRIEDAAATDTEGNVSLNLELTAGTTYLIEMSEFSGQSVAFDFRIDKPEYGIVRFHANEIEPGEAYFDGDPTKTVKEIRFKLGTDIHRFLRSGLEVENPYRVSFIGWSVNKDAEDFDHGLYVTESMDVYAVYTRFETIVLDANGGTFNDGTSVREQNYVEEEPFYVMFEPTINDPDRAFSGWATTKDAAWPDITEMVDLFQDMPDTVYAVYGEKIKVTFDGNGGYFYQNPAVTKIENYRGKGHIFFGAAPYMDDPNMRCMGWRDQDGNFLPLLTENPLYRYEKDTVFTAVWARSIAVDANGGCFRFNKDLTEIYVAFPADDVFTEEAIIETAGAPINFDDMKYLAGYATTPDAEAPDVIEGVTLVSGLDRIYALWKDDSYYVAEGDKAVWEKGSGEALRIVAKRTGDDAETMPHYRGILIDGEQPPEGSFTVQEGSVIITLKSEYLETLAAGKHTLTFDFGEVMLDASFTVKEKEEAKPDEKVTPTPTPTPAPDGKNTPATGDTNKPIVWVVIACAAAAACILAVVLLKKKGGKDDEE